MKDATSYLSEETRAEIEANLSENAKGDIATLIGAYGGLTAMYKLGMETSIGTIGIKPKEVKEKKFNVRNQDIGWGTTVSAVSQALALMLAKKELSLLVDEGEWIVREKKEGGDKMKGLEKEIAGAIFTIEEVQKTRDDLMEKRKRTGNPGYDKRIAELNAFLKKWGEEK